MVFHGITINWGVRTNIQGASGLFQTREHNTKINSEVITDGGDTPVSKVYWGKNEVATFTYVAAEGSYAAGNNYGGNVFQLNNADGGYSEVYWPAVGTWVYLSDVAYPYIAGNWLVDDVTTNTSNTTATRVILKLSRYPKITP